MKAGAGPQDPKRKPDDDDDDDDNNSSPGVAVSMDEESRKTYEREIQHYKESAERSREAQRQREAENEQRVKMLAEDYASRFTSSAENVRRQVMDRVDTIQKSAQKLATQVMTSSKPLKFGGEQALKHADLMKNINAEGFTAALKNISDDIEQTKTIQASLVDRMNNERNKLNTEMERLVWDNTAKFYGMQMDNQLLILNAAAKTYNYGLELLTLTEQGKIDKDTASELQEKMIQQREKEIKEELENKHNNMTEGMKREIEGLTKEVKTLQEGKHANLAQITGLELSLQQAQHELNNALTAINVAQSKKEQFRNKNAAEMLQLFSDMNEWRMALDKSHAEVDDMKLQIASLQSERERMTNEYEEQVSSLRSQVRDYNEALQKETAERDTLEQYLRAEKSKNEQLIQDKEAETNRLHGSLNKHRQAMEALQGEIEDLQRQMDAASGRKKEQSEKYQAELYEVTTALQEYQQAFERASAELAKMKENKEKKESERELARRSLKKRRRLESEMSHMVDESEHMRLLYEKSDSNVKDLQKKLADAQENLSKKENALNALKSEVERVTNVSEGERHDKQQFELAMNAKIAELDRITNELAAERHESKRLAQMVYGNNVIRDPKTGDWKVKKKKKNDPNRN
jgi:chromosome segregation ATPase